MFEAPVAYFLDRASQLLFVDAQCDSKDLTLQDNNKQGIDYFYIAMSLRDKYYG
jgi:hypothetical protein